MTKQELIDFEKEVARRYEAGDIRSPVHLSGGNEEQLIEIFKDVKPQDWKLSTWRNHYHALLSEIPPEEVMRQILVNRSMCMNSAEHNFYTSSIAGGILPIAVGLGMGAQRKNTNQQVWVFVGDMVSEMGIFIEAVKYSIAHDLPVHFVVENNGKSVQTDTMDAWGNVREWWEIYSSVHVYDYTLTWPHHGTGKWIPF